MEELLKGPSGPAIFDAQKSGTPSTETTAETARSKEPFKSEPSAHQFLESLFRESKKQVDASCADGSGESALVVLVNQKKKRQDTGFFTRATPSMNRTLEQTIFGKGVSDNAATTQLECEGDEICGHSQTESSAQITTSAQLGFPKLDPNPGNFDVLHWCFADSPNQK